jgi:CubicO group peptidase (beta-lactamase class C family)
MQNAARAGADSGYGFMWWLPILPDPAAKAVGPVYMASGWGDQYIIVVPDRGLVVVLTGGNYYNEDPNTMPIISAMLGGLFL